MVYCTWVGHNQGLGSTGEGQTDNWTPVGRNSGGSVANRAADFPNDVLHKVVASGVRINQNNVNEDSTWALVEDSSLKEFGVLTIPFAQTGRFRKRFDPHEEMDIVSNAPRLVARMVAGDGSLGDSITVHSWYFVLEVGHR